MDNTNRSGQKRRKKNGNGNGNSTSAMSASSSTTTDNKAIPGFYYDSDRRRYFRILPDHLGASGHCVTPQSLKQQHRELERQRILENPVPTKINQNGENGNDGGGNRAFSSIVRKQQLGLINDGQYRRFVTESRVTSAEKKGTVLKFRSDTNDAPLIPVLFEIVHLQVVPDGRNMFAYAKEISWCSDEDPAIIFWPSIVRNRGSTFNGDNMGVRLEFAGSCGAWVGSDCTITDMLNVQLHGTAGLLFCGDRFSYSDSVISLIAVPSRTSGTTDWEKEEWVFPQRVWSCGWSQIRRWASVGIEQGAAIWYLDSTSIRKLKTGKKTPLVQRFSTEGNLLYMGLRNSDMTCFDLRTRESSFQMNQSNVSSLHLMSQDNNYAIAADFTGKMQMWDLRARKAVMSYEGQVNSHSKLPLIVDEERGLIVAGGEDGTTRCWSLQSSELLRQIASPVSTSNSKDTPAVCYSNCWGGVQGNAAVGLGIRDKLHLYPV